MCVHTRVCVCGVHVCACATMHVCVFPLQTSGLPPPEGNANFKYKCQMR